MVVIPALVTLPLYHATPNISALKILVSRNVSGLTHPMPSISPAVPVAPPPGHPLQPPLTLNPTPREPAHSDLLDAGSSSSSSSSSCPPCSPEPGREAPGPEPAAAAVGSGVSGERRSEKGRLYCPTCKVTVNSASQLQAHNTGQWAPPAEVWGKERDREAAPHQMGAG